MTHIYLFDYYSPARNNGVDTYTKNLANKVKVLSGVEIYFVWVDSTFSLEIKEVLKNEVSHIHLPNDPIFGGENNEQNVRIASFFKEKTAKQKEVIFHLIG